VDRIKPFDPWTTYEDACKERASVVIPRNPVDSDLNARPAIGDDYVAAIDLIAKFHNIMRTKGAVKKPRNIKAAARNWNGDWIPYNEDLNFEVIRILDRREGRTKGTFEWLTQWKGDWLPTWEPFATFKDNASTGMGLVWQAFERITPYDVNIQPPVIPGAAQRKH
jgi:hypothetical protein